MSATIAVTGVGLVTADGDTADQCWTHIVEGRSGITTNTLFDTSALLTSWAGQVQTEQDDSVDRCYALASTAVTEALRSSGLEVTEANRDRIALVVGSSLGAMPTLEATHRQAIETGVIDAGSAAGSQLHCVADHIAAEFDLRGPRVVTSNACAAGAVAVGYAAELLWAGDADIVLCGGVDPLATLSFNGFTCLGALDPEPCSPMAASTGLTLGEGAGFMVLERDAAARARDATVVAEVAGYGTTCDGYHQTAPDPGGDGAFKSMAAALRTAQLKATDVDYVNLHGTGTPTNDAVEPKALRLLFGKDRLPPASSTKSAIGHTLGAAGAIETICSILAIDRDTLPPTINTRGRGEATGLDIVPEQGRSAAPDVVLSNSFAFGGNNASVVVNRPGHQPDRAAPTPHRQVVVTGVAGMAGAAGTTEDLLAALSDGTTTCTSHQPTRTGATVPVGRLDTSALVRRINPAKARRMDPLGIISSAIVADLYQRHGKPGRGEAESTGIIFATGYGPVTAVLQFNEGLVTAGTPGANPLVFPNTVVNAAAGHLAMLNRYRGYTATLACGGTSAVMALQLATRVIARGGADRIMVVVADEFHELAFQTAAQLPGYRHDLNGQGAVLSDGAVAVLLEAVDAATARGASPKAIMRGFGASGEPAGIGRTGTDGLAWARAINQALDQAGARAQDVTAVMSSASGHRRLDAVERRALHYCGLSQTPSVAIKHTIGETQGSAAGLALLAGLAAEGRRPGDVLLVTSCAAGGSYAAMVVEAS